MASATQPAVEDIIGDSDTNRVTTPERRSLDKRDQTIPNKPQGSPNSTQSTTSSAASFDLAGRIMAFEAAHTLVGQNGEKNHGAGSPMHRRNRSGSKAIQTLPLEFNKEEKRDDSDDFKKFNAALMNETLSTITNQESELLSNADKESVVSSASRISSLSQKILQNAERPSSKNNNDKDSVVSSASRISSLSQKMIREVSNDDKESEDSILLSANLIASLSQKILEKQNEKGSADSDSVLSSAALITSLSQRILQSRSTPSSTKSRRSCKSHSDRASRTSFGKVEEIPGAPSGTAAKSRSSFTSQSSRTSRASFEKVEEITSGDKPSSVTSSVSQISSVSQRIKALEKTGGSSPFTSQVSPTASFSSTVSPKPPRSSSKASVTSAIDSKSMSRIQERIRAMQKADASSSSSSQQRPNRPSWAKRSSNNTSRSNPQDATRPVSPPATGSVSSSSQPPPTETVEAYSQQEEDNNNISGMTMEEDVATTTSRPKSPQQQQQRLTLENVSELAALADPKLPPSIHRFPVMEQANDDDENSSNAPSRAAAASHVSLPNPIVLAMDAMRQYSTTSPTKTTKTKTTSTPLSAQNYSEWFPPEHFDIANALFPEHQFGVNDEDDAVNNNKAAALAESQSLPPMRVRSHSEGDINNNDHATKALDDHGFPKFLESQRDATDKVPHHIQFSDDDRVLLEQKDEQDRNRAARGEAGEEEEERRRKSTWHDLGREVLKYNWKDQLPIIMGCLLILVGIIVGITLAALSGQSDELANFDLDQAPSAQLCEYVKGGYSIPGEESFHEVDLNWLLDVSFTEDPNSLSLTSSSTRLTTKVQELFQANVIPMLVGCDPMDDNILEGQYLVANGYAWSVRDIGNCDYDAPSPCSRLLVSFVLWTKARRDPESMNGFASSNFGNAALAKTLERGETIEQVTLVRMTL